MSIWHKLVTTMFGLSEKDKAASRFVCSKCGLSHALGASSFMMSPRQAFDQIANSGMMVLPVGDGPAQYMVGEVGTFPAEAKERLLSQSVDATQEALISVVR